jgi:hypothetical protein
MPTHTSKGKDLRGVEITVSNTTGLNQSTDLEVIDLDTDSRAGLLAAINAQLAAVTTDPATGKPIRAITGRVLGNGKALLLYHFDEQNIPAWGVPPSIYVTTKVRTLWLPTVSGGGAYSGTPDVAVFGGRMLERPFKQLEAIIRVRGDDQSSPLDLSGGAGIDKTNSAEWYGLDIDHVYYAAMPQTLGYKVGSTWTFEPWHLFIYRRWLNPAPNAVNPHDAVYVDEDGAIKIESPDSGAIATPLPTS